jgi:hypothetical protein
MFLEFFSLHEFFIGTIMTLYAITFSRFPTGFHEFLHKYLLYTSLDFFPEFFKDSIHSIRCLSAQGGVLQHEYIVTT